MNDSAWQQEIRWAGHHRKAVNGLSRYRLQVEDGFCRYRLDGISRDRDWITGR
ncbi:MAG: hypothetical protein L0Z50_26785 [Verrucomicrobiales bacterium]|nr:hypothetical protein [Verrucomicrobiales bacterium]